MAHHFRQPERRQKALLPADMMEWLAEDDIVHLIVEAVGMMDLAKFEASYCPESFKMRGRGASA